MSYMFFESVTNSFAKQCTCKAKREGRAKKKMASRGTIETFDPTNPQAWTTYEERLEFYMGAQKIVADEEKRAAKAAPAAVKQKKYEEIIKLLRDHFVPKTSSIVSRFQFIEENRDQGNPFPHSLENYGNWLKSAILKPVHSTTCYEIDWCAASEMKTYSVAYWQKKHSHLGVECHFCKKVGHIERVCLSKKRQQGQQSTRMKQSSTHQQTSIKVDEPNEYSIYNSGAAHSVVGKSTFEQVRRTANSLQLKQPNVILKDYQKQNIDRLGACDVTIKLKSRCQRLALIVTEQDHANLLDRNWFEALGIAVVGINSQTAKVTDLYQEFEDVFSHELDKFKGTPLSFNLDANVKPIICKARKVPYAMKPLIEKELEDLEKQGVLEPVSHPNWATPIVAVMKSPTEVRICGDYKSTLNTVLHTDTYPIPSVQSMLAVLAGGKYFARLDLRQTFQQLTVTEETAEAQTLITHKGAFRVKRLQFGINIAPHIFQRFIDLRLAGIPGVLPYFDDILVVASSMENLKMRLRAILSRFREDGLRLRKEKCILLTNKVQFLGYEITEEGIRPSEEKKKAIIEVSTPRNVEELTAFLGMLNFYSIFQSGRCTGLALADLP
ncbi:uncharacterized protein K02A2.6-like [Zophobas morio]|uniref:uncharacterized protein K02A2.6-like n=1 Tax=Zophobas morio TaxID=2755281 RepID=UPI0030838D91